jgi:hypothetical protein
MSAVCGEGFFLDVCIVGVSIRLFPLMWENKFFIYMRTNTILLQDEFIQWVKREANLPESTAESYCSYVSSVNNSFSIKYNDLETTLFDLLQECIGAGNSFSADELIVDIFNELCKDDIDKVLGKSSKTIQNWRSGLNQYRDFMYQYIEKSANEEYPTGDSVGNLSRSKQEEQKGSSKIDGINVLRNLFPDDDSFVRHVVGQILFFNAEIITRQASVIQQQIEKGEAIPVRYTSNAHFYHQREVNKVKPSFKSRKEAVNFKDNPLFHKETKMRVYFDKDGNYYPKRAILQYTGHWVSGGKTSTITNYTIAHIWGKTDNPLYFGLLWNYCLIPTPYAFLTDKDDSTNILIKRIKDLIKAISIKLYKPNSLMNDKVSVETPPEDVLTKAERLIEEDKICFVPVKD